MANLKAKYKEAGTQRISLNEKVICFEINKPIPLKLFSNALNAPQSFANIRSLELYSPYLLLALSPLINETKSGTTIVINHHADIPTSCNRFAQAIISGIRQTKAQILKTEYVTLVSLISFSNRGSSTAEIIQKAYPSAKPIIAPSKTTDGRMNPSQKALKLRRPSIEPKKCEAIPAPDFN